MPKGIHTSGHREPGVWWLLPRYLRWLESSSQGGRPAHVNSRGTGALRGGMWTSGLNGVVRKLLDNAEHVNYSPLFDDLAVAEAGEDHARG